MMQQVFGQYFWGFCLAICLVHYVLARRKLLREVPANGVDVEHGLQVIKWFWLANTLPWLIMGLGQLSALSSSVWDYFRPQDGNPAVIAWFVSLFLLMVIFAVWVLFKGGARDIRVYRLFTGFRFFGREIPMSENMIKLISAVMPFWILFCFFMMARMEP